MYRKLLFFLIFVPAIGCGKQERVVIRDGDTPIKRKEDKASTTRKASPDNPNTGQPKKQATTTSSLQTRPANQTVTKTKSPPTKKKTAPDKAGAKPSQLDDKPTKPLTFDPNQEAPTIVRPLSVTHAGRSPAKKTAAKKTTQSKQTNSKQANSKQANSKQSNSKQANSKQSTVVTRPLNNVEQQLVGTWVCRPQVPSDQQLDQFLRSAGVPAEELAAERQRARQTIQKSQTTLLVRPDGTLRQIDQVTGRPAVEQDAKWSLAAAAAPSTKQVVLQLGMVSGTDVDTGKAVISNVKVQVDLLDAERIRWHLPQGLAPFPGGMEFRKSRSVEHLRLIPSDDAKSVASLRRLRVQLDEGVKGEITGLTLSDESIKAAAPYLRGLRNLRRLHAGFGSVKEILPTVGGMSSLKELFLDASGLTDAQLGPLVGLTDLERLSLRGNPITDKGLATIARIGSLRRLILRETRITDSGLAQLSALKKLDSLDVSGTKINGTGLSALQGCPQFMHLAVAATPLNEQGLTAIGGLSKLKSLAVVKCTQLTDKSLTALGKLPNLEELYIAETSLSGAQLPPLRKLTALHATKSQFSDQGLARLAQATRLRSLALDTTKVTDAGLVHLKSLHSLRVVSLAGNKIGGTGLTHLSALKKLEMLQLANTQVKSTALPPLSGSAIQVLGLAGTSVDNQAIDSLLQLKSLRLIELQNTRVDNAGKQRLQRAFPKLQIR